MSNSLDFNTIAMGVLSAALFAFGGKTFIDIVSRNNAPEKPAYSWAAKKTGTDANGPEAKFNVATAVFPLLAKADANAGADTFKKCAACHNNAKDAGNKVGPNLWNVVGRPVASIAGFAYSDAMKAKGGSWTWEALGTYLHDPRAAVPGNKMAFIGVDDNADLADLLAYLRKLSDNPPDLPK